MSHVLSLTALGLLARIALSAVQAVLALGLAYNIFLLLAAALPTRAFRRERQPGRTFAIAIPAHNEASVVGQTVRQLRRQTYPAELFDVYVVADHCSDDTAQVAREAGAICYERSDQPRGRKGYALQWLLERILRVDRAYDALVVFDADSQVDPHFLRAMNDALAPDRMVLQGQHVIVNPQETPFSGLAAVDMRLNNLLRNRAKENLGLSGRLMGDAMCFATPLLRRYGWSAEGLTEDREYGLYLLSQGVRVRYVNRALSYGQAAPGWHDASTQRLRWYGGVLQLQRRFALDLLGRGLRHGDWAAVEQAVELLLPPFSVLAVVSCAIAGVQALLPMLRLLLPPAVSFGFLAAWALFPVMGLLVDRAPLSTYGALAYGPFYVAWRLAIGLKARVLGQRVPWARTTRREDTASPE